MKFLKNLRYYFHWINVKRSNFDAKENNGAICRLLIPAINQESANKLLEKELMKNSMVLKKVIECFVLNKEHLEEKFNPNCQFWHNWISAIKTDPDNKFEILKEFNFGYAERELIWIGRFHVKTTTEKSEKFNLPESAYVNIIGRGISEEDFILTVRNTLIDWGFNMVGIEEVQTFENFKEKFQPSEKLIRLAFEAMWGHELGFDDFHEY